jgi:hypothetical protein
MEDQELAGYGLLCFFLGMIVGLIPATLYTAKDAVTSWFFRIVGPPYWIMLYARLFGHMRHAASEFNKYGWGGEGEELMVEHMRRYLDHRWTIVRNFHPRNAPGDNNTDIDIVLVGPAGVYALHVKRPHQNTRCNRLSNEQWQRQTRRGWEAAPRNHGKDARDLAKKLRKFLEQQGVKGETTSVHPVVALATDLDPANFSSRNIDVWLPATLAAHMANLRTTQTLSEPDVAQITTLLKDLVEQQRAERARRRPFWFGGLRRIVLPRYVW